jgi:hypothetical protein
MVDAATARQSRPGARPGSDALLVGTAPRDVRCRGRSSTADRGAARAGVTGLAGHGRHRQLDPDHPRRVGGPKQPAGSRDARAGRAAAGGAAANPARPAGDARPVGRGDPRRRRRGRRAGRGGARGTLSRMAAAHGGGRRRRDPRGPAARGLNGHRQLRDLRPDGPARPRPVRDDPLAAAPGRGSDRQPVPPDLAQVPVALRAAGHRRAVGGGRAGRHLGGRDHPLAEDMERDRVPRGRDRPGQAAARRPGPPGPGAPAVVGQPVAALGTDGGRASGRPGGCRVRPRSHAAAVGRRRRRPGGPGPGGRAPRRGRGRLHADLPAVRRGAGPDPAPVHRGAGRGRDRGRRRRGARLRVDRVADLPHAGPPPGQGRRGHLLSADLDHVQARAAADHVPAGHRRVRDPGRGDAVAPAGRGAGEARHPARAGDQPGLAVHLVLPAALVRHDGHRPARGVPGLPAGLGRARAADRRDDRPDAGHGCGDTPALACPAGVPDRVPADGGRPVLLPGLPGLAVRDRILEHRPPARRPRARYARAHGRGSAGTLSAPAQPPGLPRSASAPAGGNDSGTVLPVIRDRTLVAKHGHQP